MQVEAEHQSQLMAVVVAVEHHKQVLMEVAQQVAMVEMAFPTQ
jgi:hypothetical protein